MSDRSVAEYVASGWGDRAGAFLEFMNAVDEAVVRKCGMGVDDLPDFDYACAFEDESDPEDVADEVLEESMY